jgi:ribosomal protein S18 acetylase RimI-like enzyme
MTHPLDNPVWHALTGAHADFALGAGAARHYPRDIAPFSALEAASPEAYADLARDLPPGLEARLFRPTEEPPPLGWKAVSARPIRQMVLDAASLAAPHPHEEALRPLGPGCAAAMLALAEAAQPGPFGLRTPVLGRFLGFRGPDGRLLAMAGERFLLPGHVELSAICVHPEARGRGLGAALTLRVAREALARGEVPFLHVFPDNPAASLYASLGFRERATLWVLWHRPVT